MGFDLNGSPMPIWMELLILVLPFIISKCIKYIDPWVRIVI
jgi:hypothetical protein